MKNLLLSLAVLCTTSSMFAQLYVAPTASTDSYIYVKDEVIFVDDEINLVANSNDPTTEASIYLRDGAQLIQGSATVNSANTGNGFISIYQDSNSDAYDYNFWCSPIGNMNGTGNRNFGMARMNDVVDVTDSNVALTTAGHNGSSTPLRISTRWLYRWNPATQRYVWNGTGHTVPAGFGFTMKGTDVSVHTDPFNDPQNQVYDFRGRPNNGNIVHATQTGVASTDGLFNDYTFAGNPYPSALDLNEVFFDADNGEIDSFRFWDEDRSINSHYYVDNKGGFGTWIPIVEDDTNPGAYTRPTFYNYNNGGGQGTSTGDMGPVIERRFSPVGQGFMVKANSTGSITIKNAHREHVREGAGNNSQFRNPDSDSSATSVVGDPGSGQNNANVTPQIRVVTIFGENSHMRDMLLLFHDLSTDGYDRGMDATHPMDADKAEAYFPIGVSEDTYKNLVIQTIPFEISKKVPMAFELENETKFVVGVEEQINTPFQKAYLFDNVAGTYQEITDGKDAVVFLPAGTYEGRFFITFRGSYDDDSAIIDNPVSDGHKRLLEDVDFFQNNAVASLEVSNPEGYDIKTVNIFDMSGKLVLTQQNLGTQRRLSFPTANFSDGVYLVKLTTTDNFTTDYKITVFNK